jgi:hypothetical protein
MQRSIQGAWEGRYVCQQGPTGLTLTISGDNPSQLRAIFRFYPVPENPRVPAGEAELTGSFDAAIARLQLKPGRWIKRPTGYNIIGLTGLLSPDGESFQGAMDAQGCGAITLTRAREGAPPVEASVQRRSPGKPRALASAANFAEQCEILSDWLNRLPAEYPDLDLGNTPVNKIEPLAANLYRDEYFVPVFGKAFDQFDAETLLRFHRDIVRRCYSETRGLFGSLRHYMDGPMNRARGNFGGAEVGSIIAARRVLRETMNRALEASQGFPATAESYDKLEQYANNAKRDYADLWPSEVKEFEEALAKARGALAKAIAVAWLGEMKAVDLAKEGLEKIPAGVKQNSKFISAMSDSERADLNRALADKLTDLLGTALAGKEIDSSVMLAGAVTLQELLGSRTDDAARAGKGRIAAVLETHIGNRMAEAEKFGAGLEGFVSFAMWTEGLEREIAPFGEYEAVRRARAVLAEKSGSLRTTAAGGVQKALGDPASYKEFLPVRDSLVRLQKTSDGMSLSGPLWTEYESAVERWMQKQIAATGTGARAEDGATAPASDPLGPFSKLPGGGAQKSSAFSLPDLAEGHVLSAIYRKDFAALYNGERAHITYYLMNFTGAVHQTCPGTVPYAAIQSSMESRVGKEIFQGGPAGNDAMVELGLNVLLQMGKDLANPSDMLARTVKSQELMDKGHGDARRVLQQIGCDDPAWKTFFAHMTAYMRDPTEGMDPRLLTMTDICTSGMIGRAGNPQKYCSCAGPILDSRLTETQKGFVRLDPKENVSMTLELLPTVAKELVPCQQ